MNTFKDALGTVNIPQHLLDKAAAYVPIVKQESTSQPKILSSIVINGKTITSEWIAVKTIHASRGNSMHTVEARLDEENNDVELKCSCQGFRIQKKGYCKHTTQVREENGL